MRKLQKYITQIIHSSGESEIFYQMAPAKAIVRARLETESRRRVDSYFSYFVKNRFSQVASFLY